MSVETLLSERGSPMAHGHDGAHNHPVPPDGRYDAHRHASTGAHAGTPALIRPSVLRLSLAARLVLAAALLLPLWIAVALVVG